jgi:hypothetical protein
MESSVQIHVGGGTVRRYKGLSFGGFHRSPAQNGEPTRVTISVWDETTSAHDFELSVGESLEFSGQSWRLDEIDDSSHRWYATLTRVV